MAPFAFYYSLYRQSGANIKGNHLVINVSWLSHILKKNININLSSPNHLFNFIARETMKSMIDLKISTLHM